MSDLSSFFSLSRVREASAGFKAAAVMLVGSLVAALSLGVSPVATARCDRAST
jgi:hypothetical protein